MILSRVKNPIAIPNLKYFRLHKTHFIIRRKPLFIVNPIKSQLINNGENSRDPLEQAALDFQRGNTY